MAGLVPAIHVLTCYAKDVDARHKAGMTILTNGLPDCRDRQRAAPIERNTASLGQQSTLKPAFFW
jgi:hypothetical protein